MMGGALGVGLGVLGAKPRVAVIWATEKADNKTCHIALVVSGGNNKVEKLGKGFRNIGIGYGHGEQGRQLSILDSLLPGLF